MSFATLYYVSFVIFLIGLGCKCRRWFSAHIGSGVKAGRPSHRLAAAARGLTGVLFSSKLTVLLKTFVLDVLLLKKTFRESFLRWLAHMLIFAGFMLLLIFHALDHVFVEPIAGNYYPTLNPFFFLRDAFGVMVLAGLCLAVCRRSIRRRPHAITRGMDIYAIVILSLIVFSGIVLQAMKMTALSEFEMMVEDYSSIDDESELAALESLWVKEYGLASVHVQQPFDPDVIQLGREIHALNCADCHAPASWAFASFGMAKIIRPISLAIDNLNGVSILWYLHILTGLFGLAYLPFSKMFHIIATPLSLLVNSVMDDESPDRANVITRQILELDACTHCGACSRHCSAMMACDATGNVLVLPSEKMVHLKKLPDGKKPSPETQRAIREGVVLCTNCNRCTVVCPSGIRLKELWIDIREDLLQEGGPEPLILSGFSLLRGLRRLRLDADQYASPLTKTSLAVSGGLGDSGHSEAVIMLAGESMIAGNLNRSFLTCFGCRTCTIVCPVVAAYENPQTALGLLPHQIMYALGLGEVAMASRAPMIWDCVTCYLCQEHCPQKVKVTEVLYGLKNRAVRNFKIEN